ncbi:MAG TPA: polyphosphate kinase 2 family protein [Planctomicrobium sp.]|nr:polyphosphate kinase 2 family protein [Planctomicrobium sp.]
MPIADLLKLFRVKPGKTVRLSDFDPGWAQTDQLADLGKKKVRERAEDLLADCLNELKEAQELLYADNRHALLIILQAMDAAGKDGTIKHVMSGVNPQGCQVSSFKIPSAEELDHTFLWRYTARLPERGCIGIFNRSYYEEVLVVRVHPETLERQNLPPGKRGKSFWNARYDDINALEQHLVRNGTTVLKFFLNISREEQRRRFLDRLNDPDKHWKFSPADLHERGYWDDYIDAYERMLSATSTDHAPWYVIPADNKWVTRASIAYLIASTIRSLDLAFPSLTAERKQLMEDARRQLADEGQ